MFIIVFISVAEIFRIKKVEFPDNLDQTIVRKKIVIIKNERPIQYIFGILKTSAGLSDLKVFGSSFLGVGKIFYPENTILFTDQRLIFIQVPVSGGNKIIGGTDYVQYNFFYNREEIRQKGKELFEEKPIKNILVYAIDDVSYNEIKKLTLNKTLILIEKVNGEKFQYLFLDKEYIDIIKDIGKKYLKDKFFEKS